MRSSANTALCWVQQRLGCTGSRHCCIQYEEHCSEAEAMYIYTALQRTVGGDHQTRIRPKAWVLPAQTSTGDTLAFHEDDDGDVNDWY